MEKGCIDVHSRYLKVKKHVTKVALQCGRDPQSITIVAVTKGHQWQDIFPAYDAGCRDFGENRILEALEKIPHSSGDLRWHFIGNLQSNKVKKAIGQFTLIHSVDHPDLAIKIAEQSQHAGVETAILLQANTSGELSKQGLSAEEWKGVFSDLINLPFLKIEGLMTMAPLTDDQNLVRECFKKLRLLREDLVSLSKGKIFLPHLSMGMSHDYPLAIAEGATLLRIGTAIFNSSPSFQ